MYTLPQNYPYGCSDEEIIKTMKDINDYLLQYPMMENVRQSAPLISLGRNELLKRNSDKAALIAKENLEVVRLLGDNISKLKDITIDVKNSFEQNAIISERYTRANTSIAVLALILTFAAVFYSYKQAKLTEI